MSAPFSVSSSPNLKDWCGARVIAILVPKRGLLSNHFRCSRRSYHVADNDDGRWFDAPSLCNSIDFPQTSRDYPLLGQGSPLYETGPSLRVSASLDKLFLYKLQVFYPHEEYKGVGPGGKLIPWDRGSGFFLIFVTRNEGNR